MCGIAGSLFLGGSAVDRQTRRQEVAAMTRALAHRGPDAEGFWQDDLCALGHRRLAILDLSDAGRQPMTSSDGSDLQLVFNGEIYNFLELRRTLEKAGAKFETRTDTEVLLSAYRQWGVECFSRLRGMFAVAIWDGAARRLILARDRVGKKPLFYSQSGDQLYFASEIQGLLALPSIPRQIDREGIDIYLSHGYIPAPRSGFAAISKLLPGHFAVWEAANGAASPRIERYWQLDYRTKLELDEPEAVSLLQAELTEAVRLRMVSDVPVGAFLSGGIDSSIIVGLMAQLSSRPVRTFSIGFTSAHFDELAHARRVADRWQTEHHELVVEPDALQILPELLRHLGEPMADVSIIPTWYLARMTRSSSGSGESGGAGVRVALNGDGGDESFVGYERYLANYLATRLSQLVGGRRGVAGLGSLARFILLDSIAPGRRTRQLRRFLQLAAEPMPVRYPRWLTYFTAEEKRELYADDAPSPPDPGLGHLGRLVAAHADLDPVEVGMAVDVLSYLPDDLLVKVDIATMANGLEARSPFLDQQVMELAARLPVRLKMRRREPKYLLKRAFAHLLPAENLNRSKMGFGVPVGEWFRGPLRGLVREALLGASGSHRLFRRPVLERYLARHLAGEADYSFQLWNLLILELWLKSTGGGD